MRLILNLQQLTTLQIFYESYSPLLARVPLTNLTRQSKHTLMFLKSPKHFKVGKHKVSMLRQRGISQTIALTTRNLLSLLRSSNDANFNYLQKRIPYNIGGVSSIRKFYLTIPCKLHFYGW